MHHFKSYPSQDSTGISSITIASGPVIVCNGKVLLVKDNKDNFWKFPGGTMQKGESPEATAKREAYEEVGLEIECDLAPFVYNFIREKDEHKEYVILFHFFCKKTNVLPSKGQELSEWIWCSLESLPNDCAPNIQAAIEHFQAQEHEK